jgi:cyclophilin family peptidyl-prolyl cis-trans isomerase
VKNDPYYDDIVFNRVITNFMIQCGSPKGDGSDGPGYSFQDEFDPTLRHDHPGTVSMANSGPNSNGGQFFITVANTPWLDDVHTVFGSVVEGMDIVSNIAAVAVDANDRPVDDVVITNAFITRNGTNAMTFNPRTVSPVLPIVRPAEGVLFKSGNMWVLGLDGKSGLQLLGVRFGPAQLRMDRLVRVWHSGRVGRGQYDSCRVE